SEVTVVHNVICSQVVPETIDACGARALRTRVGHSFIKDRMAEHDAVFGGEHSAHYYFRDFFFADSGMLAAPHVLAAVGRQDGPLSRVVARHERQPASGEVRARGEDVAGARAGVREWGTGRGAAADTLDGLSLRRAEVSGPYGAL